MKKILFFLFFLLSLNGFCFEISILNYYDSTFGDYIPQSLEEIAYSNGYFFVVSQLSGVSQGDTVSLTVVYPDGTTETYEETSSIEGDAVYFKKVDLRGLGNYSVSLTFNGDTEEIAFSVIPDSTEDPFEPDNYPDNIFYLERGSVISLLTSPSDMDYYRLKVDKNVHLKLSLNSEIDLALSLFKDGEKISSSDMDFDGNESVEADLEEGEYTVLVYSPVKETGRYVLTVNGDFPVFLPLSDFDRNFDKRVVVSNLSDAEGDVVLEWYDFSGNRTQVDSIRLLPFETKEFDGTDFSYLKCFPEGIEVNASVYGLNTDKSEAIAYEARMLDINNVIVSHIATQTYLYETEALFSFNKAGTYLNYQSDLLAENFVENSSFLVNFNDFYQNSISTPWGVASSDADLVGVEMFRLIQGDYFQATALTLSPNLARVFYLPHIDVRYFWWTGISVVNPESIDASVKLIALDSQGNQVAETDFTIEGGGKSVDIVNNYFENGLPENAASLKIVSDIPVQGLYLFGTKRDEQYSEDIFGGLNSSAFYSKKLYFAVMPSGEDVWSGIGLFNPNEEEVDVVLKCFDKEGNLLGKKNLTLSSMEKYVSLGSDILSNDSVYRVVAICDNPICGFYLFGDKGHTYLCGLEAMR